MFTWRKNSFFKVLTCSLLLFQSHSLYAADDLEVQLEWAPNQEPDLAGYEVYHGTQSGVYGFPNDVKNTTAHKMTNLDDSKKHYFSVTAYDEAGNVSPLSKEVSTETPSSVPSTAITSPSAGVTFSPGQTVTVQGTGSNLRWSIDLYIDGKPDFASWYWLIHDVHRSS